MASPATPVYSSATAITKFWGGTPTVYVAATSVSTVGHLPTEWAQDKLSTYTQYDIGANFVIIADEQQYDYINEDRPIAVPPDSGYSVP